MEISVPNILQGPPFVCYVCKKNYKTKAAWTKHLKSHEHPEPDFEPIPEFDNSNLPYLPPIKSELAPLNSSTPAESPPKTSVLRHGFGSEATLPGENYEEDLKENAISGGYDNYERDLDRDLEISRKELLLARYERRIRELKEVPVRDPAVNVGEIFKQFVAAIGEAQANTADAITQTAAAGAETAIAAAPPQDALSQILAWATANPGEVIKLVTQFLPQAKTLFNPQQ